jgi:hypothetical protein
MTRTADRLETASRESSRLRTVLGTAIGLCLAIRPAASKPAPQILDFAARPTHGAILLTWSLPPTTNFQRLVIRFRDDGQIPASLSDGFSLYDSVAPPGALYATHHSGLSPEHTYAYAAFALDDTGAVRESVAVIAVPLSNRPPGTVRNLRRVDLVGAACAPADRSRP